jgi:hypothetical protein
LHSAVGKREAAGHTPAYRLCPDAVLGVSRRFDDVAAGRFAIVTSTDPSPAQRAAIERRGAAPVPAPPGSELRRWLRAGWADAAVVRPDGTVLRADQDLAGFGASLPRFGTTLSWPRLARTFRNLKRLTMRGGATRAPAWTNGWTRVLGAYSRSSSELGLEHAGGG